MPRPPRPRLRRADAGVACALVALATAATADDAWIAAPEGAPATFAVAEWRLRPDLVDPALATMGDDQVHDAYNADRDGTWLRIDVEFVRGDDHRLVVPAFAMRDAPGAPWSWRLRWSPDRAGTWTWRARLRGAIAGRSVAADRDGAQFDVAAAAIRGHLHPPWPGSAYVREALADGGSRAVRLFGICRAWDVASDPHGFGWSTCEGIDRERDQLPALRAGGADLLGQWMAPWEFLLVHRDRAEQWRDADGAWRRYALPDGAAWHAWSCYDQGRAAAFDRLVDACAEAPARPAATWPSAAAAPSRPDRGCLACPSRGRAESQPQRCRAWAPTTIVG